MIDRDSRGTAGIAADIEQQVAIGVGPRRIPLQLRAQPLAQMMMTMGFALFFRDAALMIWGGDPFTLPTPRWLVITSASTW